MLTIYLGKQHEAPTLMGRPGLGLRRRLQHWRWKGYDTMRLQKGWQFQPNIRTWEGSAGFQCQVLKVKNHPISSVSIGGLTGDKTHRLTQNATPSVCKASCYSVSGFSCWDSDCGLEHYHGLWWVYHGISYDIYIYDTIWYDMIWYDTIWYDMYTYIHLLRW
jgi:hypothetical protein